MMSPLHASRTVLSSLAGMIMLVVGGSAAHALTDAPFWFQDYQKAFKIARERRRPIAVLFGLSTVKASHELGLRLREDPELVRALDGVIRVQLEEPDQGIVSSLYGVWVVPCLVILDRYEREVGRLSFPQPDEQWRQELLSMLARAQDSSSHVGAHVVPASAEPPAPPPALPTAGVVVPVGPPLAALGPGSRVLTFPAVSPGGMATAVKRGRTAFTERDHDRGRDRMSILIAHVPPPQSNPMPAARATPRTASPVTRAVIAVRPAGTPAGHPLEHRATASPRRAGEPARAKRARVQGEALAPCGSARRARDRPPPRPRGSRTSSPAPPSSTSLLTAWGDAKPLRLQRAGARSGAPVFRDGMGPVQRPDRCGPTEP